MNIEYTGRHYEVTAADRKEIESGLNKIKKILRGNFASKVVLAVEKHRHKAEITISSRVGPLVALSQAKDMRAAIGNALEHLEKQALKNKTRIITRKRRNHKERDAEVATRSPPGWQAHRQTPVRRHVRRPAHRPLRGAPRVSKSANDWRHRVSRSRPSTKPA